MRCILPQAAPGSARARGQPLCCSARPAVGSPLRDFEAFVRDAQTRVCADFAALDGGAHFCSDVWSREGPESAGSGVTRVLEGGRLFEKAAANVSAVSGRLSAARASAMLGRGRPGVDPSGGQRYEAVALSLVFHGASPHVPTFRADVRAFSVEDGGVWFGGGADLTPNYLVETDVRAFHSFWAHLCDQHQAHTLPPRALYYAYKRHCDAYFHIPARREHRGVGGLFFDDVPQGRHASQPGEPAPLDAEAFCRAVCQGWLPSYEPICAARRLEPFTDAQRTWQLQRRGRYLEFNLLYDRCGDGVL